LLILQNNYLLWVGDFSYIGFWLSVIGDGFLVIDFTYQSQINQKFIHRLKNKTLLLHP